MPLWNRGWHTTGLLGVGVIWLEETLVGAWRKSQWTTSSQAGTKNVRKRSMYTVFTSMNKQCSLDQADAPVSNVNCTSIDPKQFFKHRVRLQRPNLEAKMNADEAGMQFAQCWERILYFMMPRPCPTAGHERTKSRRGHMVDLSWQSGHMVDTHKAGGHTQGRHKRSHADTRRTRGGHKVVTWLLRENPTVDCSLGKNVGQWITSRRFKNLDRRNLHTNRPGHSASAG